MHRLKSADSGNRAVLKAPPLSWGLADNRSSYVPATTPFLDSLIGSHLPVDVRTPLEFAEDHIPGAINVPLLSNEEREEIGTIYKQQGPHLARKRGLELTAHRFPEMVRTIAASAQGRPV